MKTDVIAIQRRMTDKGIDSISELSRRSGVHPNTLEKIMSGELQPRVNTMMKLMEALDIPTSEASAIFFNLDLRST